MKDREEGAGRLCPPWPWHPSLLTRAAQQQQTGAMHAQERQREMFVSMERELVDVPICVRATSE